MNKLSTQFCEWALLNTFQRQSLVPSAGHNCFSIRRHCHIKHSRWVASEVDKVSGYDTSTQVPGFARCHRCWPVQMNLLTRPDLKLESLYLYTAPTVMCVPEMNKIIRCTAATTQQSVMMGGPCNSCKCKTNCIQLTIVLHFTGQASHIWYSIVQHNLRSGTVWNNRFPPTNQR